MRKLTRDVGDKRRATELDQTISKLRKFSSIPDKKHLNDGQVAVVGGSGQLIWRDGDKIYILTGTEQT